MVRIECPSCSGSLCPVCGGLGWLLRPGIADGARGLRLETLREASAAWAGVVRDIAGSPARASRVLDCSPATLRGLLGAPAPAQVEVVEASAPVAELAEVAPVVPVVPPPVPAVSEPAVSDTGPRGCVPGCVAPVGHRTSGWHTGPDGRPWRKVRKGKK